jgi:hypothetical protein
MATQLPDRNVGHRLHGSPGRPGVNSNVRLVRGSTSSAQYFTRLNSNKRTLATNTETPGAIEVDHKARGNYLTVGCPVKMHADHVV